MVAEASFTPICLRSGDVVSRRASEFYGGSGRHRTSLSESRRSDARTAQRFAQRHSISELVSPKCRGFGVRDMPSIARPKQRTSFA